jgi:ATP-dependent Lhr-like helicase
VTSDSELSELTGPTSAGPTVPSIWPAIHPRLVALVQSHRSTMIFVNSRRLAERLAGAINELAEEELALAHHGSIAKDTRQVIEDRLKRGDLPAIVATSSLELGIDMGAVDLVIQIEAPPSIAAGLQRIGRAGHQVGAPSTGIVFPKFRGDLLACSAAAERMHAGEVEETFYPRNPLDVAAQQIVAIIAEGVIAVDDVFALLRAAAPFSDLPRSAFESVLDLLAGRYPSDEFSELRPRINWDRLAGTVSPRKGTQRTAILNAGTIPDRGLYGVFLAGEEGQRGSRVGELDEEMVFELLPNDVFLLGASSWRVIDITQDRVQVVPAPGEPGRMPFWRGDGPGRPMEFGRAIGALARQLTRMQPQQAHSKLSQQHGLDETAASNLLTYLADQQDATGEVPSDRTIIVECFLDEVGDWRVAVLSPFGARVHAPWATAVRNRLHNQCVGEVDVIWSDDGIVFRLSEADGPPENDVLFPPAAEIEELVVRELHSTSLFAARFRENAARALLLPRRSPGKRTPLWLQRRRSSDLLKVASQYQGFPIMLETFRECLRDVFDLSGLKTLLDDVQSRKIRVRTVRTETPSPFAASLLFSYTGNFIYDGDAPLAERRAAVLSLDYTQLRELLGDAALRELLDAGVIEQLALELQQLSGERPATDADGIHDLLRQLGDLTRTELLARCGQAEATLDQWIAELTASRRILEVRLAGESRFIAADDAGRFRDALGINIPPGLPDAFLEQVPEPLTELVSRFARTHGPFVPESVASRLGTGAGAIRSALQQLAAADRVIEGEFLPAGRGREWCDTGVLKVLKRRSLALLRKQVEPVEPEVFSRFLLDWHGITQPRRGLDAVLDAVEQLQGTPLPVSALESEILPARIEHYRPGDLDELCAAGEIVWQGVGSLGSSDGRIALFLTDAFADLGQAVRTAGSDPQDDGEQADVAEADRIRDVLATHGAMFFDALHGVLGGFRPDLLNTLWSLVWSGEVTNDTLRPLRSLLRTPGKSRRRGRMTDRRFRSRRVEQLPGAEGRWSLLAEAHPAQRTATERQTALALQLIHRHGILTRNGLSRENVPGGFAGLYPVCKALEEAGRVRRGYFVAGQGASQFAAPGADERLRDQRKRRTEDDDQRNVVFLSAVDPANPWGATLNWPTHSDGALQPQRTSGAKVIIRDGWLLGWLNANGESLTTFTDKEQDSEQIEACLAAALADWSRMHPVLLKRIDGRPAASTRLRTPLESAGFRVTSQGLLSRPTR